MIKEGIGLEALNILFVTGSLYMRASGVHWTLLETVRQLQGLGHQPIVIGTKDHWTQGFPEDWAGILVSAFKQIGPYPLHFVPQLGSWLDNRCPKIDVAALQGVWLYPLYSVALWCKKNGVPYILTTHGNLDSFALGISAWKKTLARYWFVDKVFAGASCFHALNNSEYQAIRKFGLKHPVCVIPNGVRLVGLKEPNQALRIKKERGFCDLHICLFLGRLHPKKGIENLLRAWGRLASQCKEWKLVLAGPGEDGYRAALETLSVELGLKDSVDFCGPQYGKDKMEYFHIADFFVLPSLSEGLPMAALEAMSHGVPVLVTEPCGLPEVKQYGAGLEVKTSVDDLGAGLLKMMAMTIEERKSMGEKAYSLVATRFQWESVARELVRVYRWILGQSPAPPSVQFD